MPDRRSHRGPHPEDRKLFATSQLPQMREAVRDMSWLLGRHYSDRSALKLVGDRYALRTRQRLAVMRCACDDLAIRRRHERCCRPTAMAGQSLVVDGYNVLTTVESALAGAVLLVARDGCMRDIASMHGSFRKVKETVPAAVLTGHALSAMKVGACVWLLDSPVSNSGRLKTLMEQIAGEHGWAWQVRLVASPDKQLMETDWIVATADGVVLDNCGRWLNLARHVVDQRVPQARVVDLSR